LESERAVLGGLLLDPHLIPDISELLKTEDFYQEGHRTLYQLMLDMSGRNEPVELLSVLDAVRRKGMTEDVGGIAYVSSLSDNVPATENLRYYAGLVASRALERRLLDVAAEVSEAVHSGQHEVPELLEIAQSGVFGLTMGQSSKGWQELSTGIDEAFEVIEKQAEARTDVTGITTGLIDLDKKLAGLQKTDLVILAARPAMGKTALALNMARAAAKTGVGVGVFSLEMSTSQLATRLLCSEARVDMSKVKTGFLSKDREWPRLVRASEDLYHLPIHIDDVPGATIAQVRTKSRRLKMRRPDLGLIIIDYIGLMQGDPRISRQEQVAMASRGLKGMAKELEVCVLCLSQLNRGVEQRPDKKPKMSDLRESGAIEQDADIIMFIFREEYYLQEKSTRPGQADIIIAKHRSGPTGEVAVAFQGELVLFSDLARGSEEYHA